MDAKFDTLIVGAFGRGVILAEGLRKAGLSVAYVDSTSRLGEWTPSDWSGPFGFFGEVPEVLRSIFKVQKQQNGFAVWNRQGPVEMRGPLAEFRFQALGLDSDAISYARDLQSEKKEALQATRRKVLPTRPLVKTWLASLAHQMSAIRYWEPYEAVLSPRAEPLMASYSSLRADRRVLEKTFQTLQNLDIKTFEATQILDISIDSKRIEGMEIAGARAGVIRAREVIWFLSHEETQRLNAAIPHRFFEGNPVEPEWAWIEFQMEAAQETVELQALPMDFLMWQDVRLPWTHENFVQVQKVNETTFSHWLRIPAKSRFQREALKGLADSLLAEWKRRLPVVEMKVSALPPEFQHSYEQRGSAKFPVFSPLGTLGRATGEFGNIRLLGPTQWAALGWTGLCEFERNWLEVIKNDMIQVIKGDKIDTAVFSP